MINVYKTLQILILCFSFSVAVYGQIVPYDTLYDQTSTPSGALKVSTHFFEGGFETNYSSIAADDFICDDEWTITKVFALGGFYNGSTNPQQFNVVIYSDYGGSPGSELYSYYNTVDTSELNGFTVLSDEDIVLPAGHYWISVSANTALGNAQWGWKPSVGSYNSEAVWENPSNGFGTGYTNWTPITTVWQGTSEKDFSFALFGINGTPASNPDPANGELAVELDKDIYWNNPENTVSIDVYWGTDPDSLNSIYSGSPISTFDQGQMGYNTDYYWRVDVRDGDGTATGKTWQFSTIQDSSLVLDENFDDFYFPPGGWVVENTGDPLWVKGIGASAFGEGEHSLRARFFSNYPPDSIGNLITYTFEPLTSLDTLYFDHAYAPDHGGHEDQLEIFYSTDSGANWDTLVVLSGGFNGELVTAPKTTFSFIPDPNEWGTLKFGVEEGTNKLKFTAVDAHGNDLYLDNIKIIDSNGEITSIDDFEVPEEFSLEQNYPNPFNPTTKIKFVLPSGVEGLTTLKVYNILGKEIATLLNETKAPGTYKVEFNASDLPSGIYFYKLSSGNFSDTKKMMLLK